jgi:ankyrin repeat protein
MPLIKESKMTLPQLHQTIVSGDKEAFKSTLASKCDPNQLDPIMGNAPLHIAVQGDDLDIIKLLLRAGAFINLQTPSHGMTPLMIAVWHRRPLVIKFLLTQPEINIEIVSTFGIKAEDLIAFIALENDDFGLQQAEEIHRLFSEYRQRIAADMVLLEEFNIAMDNNLSDSKKAEKIRNLKTSNYLNHTSAVSCSGSDGHNAILVAARDGLAETATELIKKGADQTIPDYYMKAIPLHKAAYNGNAEIIRILANAPGFHAVLDAQGPNNGYTPLHDAVWHGHVEAAEVLIKAGARKDLRGFDGKTPLELAKEYKYQNIIDLGL